MRTRMATARAIADMSTEPHSLPDRLCGQLARWRAHGAGVWFALWLALCLLFAQHAGLTHRVVHGGLLNPSQPTAMLQGADASHTDTHVQALKTSLHSCVLFDGATVADTHFGAPPAPVLKYGKPVTPASLAWRWPDLPARHPFHSRAPPAPLAFA